MSNPYDSYRVDELAELNPQRHLIVPERPEEMTAAKASDFLRRYALDNHNTISTNDLRQIEAVRTLLDGLMQVFGNFEWGSSDLQYALERLERIVVG